MFTRSPKANMNEIIKERSRTKCYSKSAPHPKKKITPLTHKEAEKEDKRKGGMAVFTSDKTDF